MKRLQLSRRETDTRNEQAQREEQPSKKRVSAAQKEPNSRNGQTTARCVRGNCRTQAKHGERRRHSTQAREERRLRSAMGESVVSLTTAATASSAERSLQLLREFDEKRLATPQDWADMEDFDEDAVIASMTARVEETWLETQRELAAEKAANGGKSMLFDDAEYSSAKPAQIKQKQQQQALPAASTTPMPTIAASSAAAAPAMADQVLKKGDTVRVTGLASRPELNDQICTIERFNNSKGRFAVRLPDGASVLLKPHNLAAHTLAEVE